MNRCDIAIIGAGPAGASAALIAAAGGARVVIFEKQPMPRPKLCGGWVSHRALRALGITLAPGISETSFHSIELRYGDRGSEYSAADGFGVFVDRAIFDAHLCHRAQEAGAELITERVTAIRDGADGVEVEGVCARYRARAAILCAGSNSNLVSAVRAADRVHQFGIGLEQRLPAELAGHLAVAPGTARIYFGNLRFGFGWVLHHGNYIVAGIGARRSSAGSLSEHYRAFWRGLGLPESWIAPQGHPVPMGGYARALGQGRVLTAGDAAGFVDAFTGEGIGHAIVSGRLAAESLIKATGDIASDYRRRCEAALLPELRASLRFARLCHTAPDFLLRSICADRAALARFSDVFDGRMPYNKYLGWIVARRLRLA